MDVPTRQSYLMAIVPPHERAWAAGISQLARAAGRMVAPMLAVRRCTRERFGFRSPRCSIKIVYDLLLWRGFRRIKPPEERYAPRYATAAPSHVHSSRLVSARPSAAARAAQVQHQGCGSQLRHVSANQ